MISNDFRSITTRKLVRKKYIYCYGISHKYEHVCVLFAFVVVLIILLLVNLRDSFSRILITCITGSGAMALPVQWLWNTHISQKRPVLYPTEWIVCMQLRSLYFRTVFQFFRQIYWCRSARNLHLKTGLYTKLGPCILTRLWCALGKHWRSEVVQTLPGQPCLDGCYFNDRYCFAAVQTYPC